MLLTGDRGVKGDEERTPLRALGGRGRFLAAMRASTSRLSSSSAASIDMTLCGPDMLESPVLYSGGDLVRQAIECGRARRGRTIGQVRRKKEKTAKVAQRQVVAKMYSVAQEAGV